MRNPALLVLALLAGAVACSGPSADSARSRHISGTALDRQSPSPPASERPSPTVSGIASGPTYVGQVLMSPNQTSDICSSVSSKPILERSHILVFTCAAAAGESTNVVAYDLLGQKVLSRTTIPGSKFAIGSTNVFYLSSTPSPASGLQAGSTKTSLTATELRTGKTLWTVPYTYPSSSDPTNSSLTVVEGESGRNDYAQTAVLGFNGGPDGSSAFDDLTGQLLWTVGHVSRSVYVNSFGSFTLEGAGYVGDGVAEAAIKDATSDNGSLTGFTAQTGRHLWTLPFPTACLHDNPPHFELVGGIEWDYWQQCYQAHDLRTGRILSTGTYPSSWKSQLASPDGVVAFDGTSISFFGVNDLNHPIWSKPASGNPTPLGVSRGHLVIQADAGLLLLQTSDGSIVKMLTNNLESGNIVNGFLFSGDQYGGNVTVIAVDPPE